MSEQEFPDRPDHPDFWMLSQVVLDADAVAESTPGLAGAGDLIEGIADGASVAYMAVQRATRHMDQEHAAQNYPSRAQPFRRRTMLAGVWADGFVAGAGFQALKLLQSPPEDLLGRVQAYAEQQAGHGDGGEQQVREAMANAIAQAYALGRASQVLGKDEERLP